MDADRLIKLNVNALRWYLGLTKGSIFFLFLKKPFHLSEFSRETEQLVNIHVCRKELPYATMEAEK